MLGQSHAASASAHSDSNRVPGFGEVWHGVALSNFFGRFQDLLNGSWISGLLACASGMLSGHILSLAGAGAAAFKACMTLNLADADTLRNDLLTSGRLHGRFWTIGKPHDTILSC